MKRLIAFSDGLWTTPAIPADSNLGLLTGAIAPRARDRSHQIILVDPFQGVAEAQPCGRRVSLLRDSIWSLYSQLALNHVPGDSLWFFGFGRGSYVVRSCIGLIRNVGLLNKQHLDRLPEAWHIYRTRWGADASNATAFRAAYSLVPRIKCLGVFDTVGERGIPTSLTLAERANEIPGFHDNQLSRAVEFAFHALAIDEQHRDLPACLWRTGGDRTQTEQCWFTGRHRDLGGIGGDPALANIPLDWMASRVAPLGLELDRAYLDNALARRNSQQRPHLLLGQRRRSGLSRAIGATNGDEILHSTAQQRFLQDTHYRPANLQAFMGRDDQIQLPL